MFYLILYVSLSETPFLPRKDNILLTFLFNMCQLSSDKIGVEHTLFTGNSGPQYLCELKSLQNHNLLKGAAWLTPVPPSLFSFPFCFSALCLYFSLFL